MGRMIVDCVFDNETDNMGYRSRCGPLKRYSYLTDLALEEGDKVTVKVGDHLKVVSVVAINVTTNRASKWVIDKVDIEGYKRREELRKEACRLETDLRVRMTAARERAAMKELLAADPDAAEMIERLDAIRKEL